MDWEVFAGRMGSMARDLLHQDSVDTTLERITGSATEIIDGCDAAGILVRAGARVHTLAPTDGLVVLSHDLQERLREGPCFDAAKPGNTDRVYRIEDLTANQDRWPRYAPEGSELGIGSMMGFLLYTENEELGALNLYSRSPGSFTTDSENAGMLLASHAAVAFSSARNAEQLHRALNTRHTIGEAMGMLIERHGLSQNDAFDVLRRLSQERNTKLHEVARKVCETGSINP
ncbi:transcription antitermination regulator [Streptomyces daqingensis]|uniref:Transcription antitermination regulator n=1 Tax=Streptomyces daqingensis TaxID=1472640 RepID=A0ABQ2MVW2_9ACTN|nr:GAF and ANTAR domain-containing protein [Streptomyces daqingensis]GGO58612.1 transcription antitermination regulator [Streptomyces daqingensis]